jgi:hypothetical protein
MSRLHIGHDAVVALGWLSHIYFRQLCSAERSAAVQEDVTDFEAVFVVRVFTRRDRDIRVRLVLQHQPSALLPGRFPPPRQELTSS